MTGTDAPTLVDVPNDFVEEKEKRKQLLQQIVCERYPKQVPYFVRVNTKNCPARTKSILDKCSDLRCTKQDALTEGRGWWGS